MLPSEFPLSLEEDSSELVVSEADLSCWSSDFSSIGLGVECSERAVPADTKDTSLYSSEEVGAFGFGILSSSADEVVTQ